MGEYKVPALNYPILAVISAGRAKIKRLADNTNLSTDHAMPGDVALVPRQQEMSWRVNGEMDVITITFADSDLCNLLQHIYQKIGDKITNTAYVGSFNNTYLFTNANHISNVLLSGDPNLESYVDAHLQAAGLYIMNYLGKKDDGLAELQLHSHPVKYTLQRLTLGISNKINIEDIAAELRLSPALLAKKFKSEMGVTPHNFLLLKRIQKAQYLLANTMIDIASIAIDCGFSHQSHLTRNFTKNTGLSPLKYRQQSQKTLNLQKTK
ncbi:helix-turn-helix domain-containing protein [Halioxenophilus aromaticivorans]|uniref:HTH araC/xylS-type domain-containing protein n=1 Tax=Halioxenophilus aromaticivorans TaxID=1306992 RepID=A0AAV3U1G1_9ALTE